MKISRITIDNFQGVRAVDLALPTPLALIAGHNGAGKSSIAEAMRLAFLGTPERVGLKKEYGALVSDGARLGAVVVELEEGTVSIALPKGTQSGEALVPSSPALPYVLAPDRFAVAKPDDRRVLLFALTGTKVRPDDIEKRLVARNCDAKLVTQIKPILRSGFAAGAEHAKQQATQAKGAWKAATGEQWGSQKAEGWAAEVPPFDHVALERASADLTVLDERIGTTNQTLGQMTEKAQAYAVAHDHLATRQALAAKLPELLRKLDFDLDEHAKLATHVEALQAKAGTGPRQGLVHDLAQCLSHLWASEASKNVAFGIGLEIKEVLATYERQYGKVGSTGDAEASAALPKAIEARDLMARSVENDRRDIAAAEAATADLNGGAQPEPVEQGDVEAVRARLTALKAERKNVDERVQGLLAAKTAAVSAGERTKNAALYHQEVLSWSAIGDALSPDGIPGEILAEALQPFNGSLADLAELAGWLPVSIDGAMNITYGGRDYRLLSESERWRVDCLLGLALASVSGLRCVVLDRFDCLDAAGRSDVLGLLDELAETGQVDSALLLGTLKGAPAAPTAHYTTYWINHGTQEQPELRAAA